MKNQKMYEADDKMISIIRDNYNILQSLGSFGINLGFGDKTVREVCEEQAVDTYTFSRGASPSSAYWHERFLFSANLSFDFYAASRLVLW